MGRCQVDLNPKSFFCSSSNHGLQDDGNLKMLDVQPLDKGSRHVKEMRGGKLDLVSLNVLSDPTDLA